MTKIPVPFKTTDRLPKELATGSRMSAECACSGKCDDCWTKD